MRGIDKEKAALCSKILNITNSRKTLVGGKPVYLHEIASLSKGDSEKDIEEAIQIMLDRDYPIKYDAAQTTVEVTDRDEAQEKYEEIISFIYEY